MLKELAQKAKGIDLDKLALQVAKANAGLISQRIGEQLTVGENSDGADVGKYKSRKYADFKQRIGSQAPYKVPDLKLSGKLHKGLFAKITSDKINISSSVSNAKFQEKRYGDVYNLQ